MPETATVTQTGLRLELVSLEMQSINDRSVKDPLLQEIIAYCVPRKYLHSFTIYGMDGDQAHLRLEVRIDYEEHEQQIKLFGDGLPGDFAGDFDLGDGPGRTASGSTQVRHCPHMGKAVDLYMRLAKDKGLRLHWTVRFQEKRAEMCAKFGLTPAIIRDASAGGVPSRVGDSLYPEVSITGRVSERVAPRG